MTAKIIEANGEKISIVDEGSGPAVLFIHSLGTNGAWLYAAQIAALKARYRCIAPDCRGHGGTSYNGGFAVPDVAADHKAVLDTLGVKQAHVVGLSMGGPIALNFNARWPEMVRSLVIADSFARVRNPLGVQDRVAATREAVAYMSMREFGSQYAADRLLPTTPIEKLDELADEIARCPPKAYVDTVQSIFTYDASGDLARVKVPTLVLVGDKDDATPMPENEFIRDGIKGATLEVIAQAGHLATIDNPEAFTRRLSAFLDRQPK
jgi:pimeloyl-ACP methyl ester carboxylesterase